MAWFIIGNGPFLNIGHLRVLSLVSFIWEEKSKHIEKLFQIYLKTPKVTLKKLSKGVVGQSGSQCERGSTLSEISILVKSQRYKIPFKAIDTGNHHNRVPNSQKGHKYQLESHPRYKTPSCLVKGCLRKPYKNEMESTGIVPEKISLRAEKVQKYDRITSMYRKPLEFEREQN